MRDLVTGACLLLAVGLGPALASAADRDPLETWRDWPTGTVAAEPPSIETIELREVWRLDCGPAAEPMVGQISAATPGRDGRVLLVDPQLGHVLVVAPDGHVERTVGRRGEGPGEVSGAYRAVALADGRVGIAAGAQAPTFMIGGRGELVLLDAAGDPAGVWLVTGDPGTVPVSMVRELRYAGGPLLVASMRTLVTDGRLYTNLRDLALVTPPDGERTLLARQVFRVAFTGDPITERQAFEAFALGRCDVQASGRVAFAPERDRWLVCVREPGGCGVQLERPWSVSERTPAQLAAATADFGVEREHACEHEPAVGRVRWRPDGRLWVEPGGVTPAKGAMACFDELSPDGELLRRVQLVAPGADEGDRLLIMEDGRCVLLHDFEDGVEDGDVGGLSDAPAVVLLAI